MFITTTDRSYLRMLALLVLLALAIFALGSLLVRAQTPGSGATTTQIGITTSTTDEPLLREYRGVSLGMVAEEARRKLGEPTDKSDQQDFYIFSETESAQIFYDSSRKVRAVSAHYSGDLGGAPTPKSLFGADVPPRADGSVYKLVRYERAGYWVSYSRTAGDSPVVSVSMQKAAQ
jgi:hypothetical protein